MATITTNTSNIDIDYLEKDYSSAEDAMITFATVQFGPGTEANRLWTDFNLSSFSRNWLELTAFISDVFYFYFDVQSTQNYLQTATVPSAVANIAKQFGFSPATAGSSSGIATLTFNSAGTYPKHSRLQSLSGLPFFTIADVVVASPGNYSVSALQGQLNNQSFTAQGVESEELNLSIKNIIVDQTNSIVAEYSPQVTVNGNSYTLVTTFINSNGTDTPAVIDATDGNVIGGGGRVFQLNQRADGTQYLEFGDGTFGRQLQPGEVVNVIYRSGGGSAGNIPAQSLTTLVDTYNFITSVTNAAPFSGGTDAQTISQLQQLIPASLRSLERAVTQQDYSDILVSNFPSVLDAEAEQNTTNPGVDINVYVVPFAPTITNITDNPVLLSDITNFLDRRKMVTTQFQILNAYGVDVLISLKVYLNSTTSQATVIASITTALQNFFNLTTGGTSGTGTSFSEEILTTDIVNLLETIVGINRFDIVKLTYRPRIQDNIVAETTTYESSQVMVFPNVTESEWLVGASGLFTRASGTVVFSNSSSIPFTYTSGTGQVQYSFPVNLTEVTVGDQFRGRTSPPTDYAVIGIDAANNILYIPTGQTVDGTPGLNAGGSVRTAATTYQSFEVFKKTLATTTNLSINSITDSGMDLSVDSGIGVVLSPNVLLDNTQVFIPGQYATGNYYLVDNSSNIWEIVANDSNTLTTSITAVNDASISNVSAGPYLIVTKLAGEQVIFNDNVFTIQYNSATTIFVPGAQFSNIGTIGTPFEISKLQANTGNLGVEVVPVNYNSSTKVLEVGNNPDFTGLTTSDYFIDSTGQVFNITAINNTVSPIEEYDPSNRNNSVVLSGIALNSKYAEGFKVPSTAVYALASYYIQTYGNIEGNLIATIVNDSGGLPNLASVVATSQPIPVADLHQTSVSNDTVYGQAEFIFTTPPTLNSGTQYHLVLNGDSNYSLTEEANVNTFTNSGINYTANLIGSAPDYLTTVTYASAVDLSAVLPGNYFEDGAGILFEITSINSGLNQITVITQATSINTTLNPGAGNIITNNYIQIGINTSSPAFPDGELARYDGTAWSNSTLGPKIWGSQSGDPSYTGKIVATFLIEGTKTITLNSNLTPVLGVGGTIAPRYYDDNDEVSFILGISGGEITSADVGGGNSSTLLATGKATVGGVGNSNVDTFVFRTSPYNDDIVNLRADEIPQIETSDINIEVFGGVT